MDVKSSPSIERPTHHVKLTQGDETLGLVLCDGNGDAQERAFKVDPTPNFPLKIASGEQKYSDMEWPPIVQDDWGAGRGQEIFEDDTTKYLDALRADTARDGITLGPEEVFTTGIRTLNQYWPWKNIEYRFISLDSVTQKIAIKFAASASYTATQIVIVVRAIGAPANLNIDICSDTAGSPGTVLETVSNYNYTSLPSRAYSTWCHSLYPKLSHQQQHTGLW